MAETVQHEQTPEGESTARWACREPGFFGSMEQLVRCASCGNHLPSGKDRKRKVYDLFKPTMHFLCDDCFDQLPE